MNSAVLSPPVNTRQVSPAELRLDGSNPRLIAHAGPRTATQVEVIRDLVEYADLMELLQSVAANGYLDIEPLIAVALPDRTYTVIEGNRRLAAIKLLLDPSLAAEAKVAVPAIAENLRATLESVTIYVVGSRSDAREFIGFKHINGPHKWDSFAKARFAADWYRQERDSGLTIRDIATRLGDRHDTVLRLVQGIFVLDQAKKHGLFTPEDRYPGRPFFFSHLYTALARPGYRDFLGLPQDWRSVDPTADPVPVDKLDSLAKLLRWLFGSAVDRVPPLIQSQNPHLKQLGEVLSNAPARQVLEESNDLPRAYTEVNQPSRRFGEALVAALRNTEEALKYVYCIEQDDEALLETAKRLKRASSTLLKSLTAYDVGAEPSEAYDE